MKKLASAAVLLLFVSGGASRSPHLKPPSLPHQRLKPLSLPHLHLKPLSLCHQHLRALRR